MASLLSCRSIILRRSNLHVAEQGINLHYTNEHQLTLQLCSRATRIQGVFKIAYQSIECVFLTLISI